LYYPGQIEVYPPPQQNDYSRTSHDYQQSRDRMNTTTDVPSSKIALIDGMVLLQKMAKKSATRATVKHLRECFNYRLMSPHEIVMKSSF